MTRTLSATIGLAFAAGALFAQAPPRELDNAFFLAQAMRAIDEKASILIELGKPDAAVKELERAREIEIPKQHPAYEMKVRLLGRLAITYTAVGRRQEGIDTIQKLLADVAPGTPAEAGAWLDAGQVYRQADMPEKALEAFDKAIELSKKLAESGRRLPPGPAGSRRLQPDPAKGPS